MAGQPVNPQTCPIAGQIWFFYPFLLYGLTRLDLFFLGH